MEHEELFPLISTETAHAPCFLNKADAEKMVARLNASYEKARKEARARGEKKKRRWADAGYLWLST